MSTPPAPSSPSNKGSISLRSRVGSLMRRASLIPSRPSSPSPSQPGRKSSSASLSRAFSRESLKSGKSAKDRGSPPDATSRKSESINEEQRPEPDRLHVQPVGPTPAGVPSPIVEVDSPLTQTNQDAPFEIPQPTEEPQQEVAKQEDAPEPEPRAPEEDAPAPLSDEPESIKQDEEPAQPEVRFEEPTPVEEEGAAKETLTIRDGPEKEGLVIRDSTPYPSQASSPVEAKPSEQTFGAAVLPERIVHDVSNPWNHEVNENFSRPPPGLQVEDPFADPPGSVSRNISTGGFSVNAGMPEPQLFKNADASSTAEVANASIFSPTPQPAPHMPLESLEQQGPSESQPLLSMPVAQDYSSISSSGKANGNAADSHALSTVPSIKYLTAGWVPCILPSARVYYFHPMVRVTTDIQLQDVNRLDRLTEFLYGVPWAKEDGQREAHVEVYVWAEGKDGKGVERYMKVDHHRRFATMWGGDALEEDTDKEYRYWLFLEHFPGHRMQAHNVHHDAVDLVSWVLSDSLLTTETNAKAPEPAAPFSKKEAENLMALLKTFEDGARHGSTPSIAHTRLISRIFLRSLDFRRTTMGRVRPFPTLPTTQSAVKPRPSGPVSKYIRSGLTALVSFLGLGIPLLFSRRSRFDEEAAGYQDTATPSLMLGASVCLVAAVLLSAAVSFLSLPGLENVPRIAILIAAIFASFAMISTVFTIFRLKSDLETAALWLGGGEDLLMISNRTILLSLPIVFLAYAIIAFVVGLVMYTFFANFEGGGGKGIEELFGEYGRWIVVAVVGALAGIFFATIVALKQ